MPRTSRTTRSRRTPTLPEQESGVATGAVQPEGCPLGTAAQCRRLRSFLEARGWGSALSICCGAVCQEQRRGDIGDVQQLGGLALGFFRSPVIALGGGHVGVSGELLHAGNIGAGVEQLADEGAAQVMGREARHVELFGQPPQAQHDRLGGHGALLDPAALGDRAQQGAGPGAAAYQPSLNGLAATGGTVDQALLAALAGTHGDLLVGVVVEGQGHGLGAAHAAAIQQRQHGGVAGAGGGVAVAAELEQPADLAGVDVAAGGQGAGGDALDVDDAFFGLGVDEPQTPGFADGAADGGQHVVDGGGAGAVVEQHCLECGDVLVADFGPVQRERIGGEPTRKDLGGALQGVLQAAAADGGRFASEVDGSGVVIQRRRGVDDRHRRGGAGLIQRRNVPGVVGRRRQGLRQLVLVGAHNMGTSSNVWCTRGWAQG